MSRNILASTFFGQTIVYICPLHNFEVNEL